MLSLHSRIVLVIFFENVSKSTLNIPLKLLKGMSHKQQVTLLNTRELLALNAHALTDNRFNTNSAKSI